MTTDLGYGFTLQLRDRGEWVTAAERLTPRDVAQQRLVRGDGEGKTYRFIPTVPVGPLTAQRPD